MVKMVKDVLELIKLKNIVIFIILKTKNKDNNKGSKQKNVRNCINNSIVKRIEKRLMKIEDKIIKTIRNKSNNR